MEVLGKILKRKGIVDVYLIDNRNNLYNVLRLNNERSTNGKFIVYHLVELAGSCIECVTYNSTLLLVSDKLLAAVYRHMIVNVDVVVLNGTRLVLAVNNVLNPVIVALNLMNSLSLPGISIWLMQCIPENKHSDFFTTSSLLAHIISALSSVFAGNLLDNFKAGGISLGGLTPAVCAFLLLRSIALLFGILETACLIRISEKPYELVDKKRGVGLGLLLQPMKNAQFMKIIVIYILYNFTSGIVGEYFNIYLLDIVKVPYTLFSYSALTSLPFYFIMIPVFAKLVNKHTWRKILPLLILGSGTAYIFNMLITLQTQFYYHIVMIVYYMFAPSVVIVFSYLPYKHMPEENRTSYIGLFTISGIVAAFLGKLCGILFMNITDGFVLNIFGKEFVNYQYLNLLQFVLFALTALYAAVIGKEFSDGKT